MKNLFRSIISASFIFSGTISQATEFKTVTDLVSRENIDLSDAYNLSIVLQRCAGLYGAVGKITPIEEKTLKEQMLGMSSDYLVIATMAMAQKRGRPLEDKAVGKQVQDAFWIYVDIYYEIMEKNQILTGSLFSEQIKSDVNICKVLIES